MKEEHRIWMELIEKEAFEVEALLYYLNVNNLIKKACDEPKVDEVSEENVALQRELRYEFDDFKNKVATLNSEEKFDKVNVIGFYKYVYVDTIQKLRKNELDDDFIEMALNSDELILYRLVMGGMINLTEKETSDLNEILSIEVED